MSGAAGPGGAGAAGGAAGGSVAEALAAAVDGLRAAGVEEPRLDAELLLAEAAGVGRARLIAEPEAQLSPAAGRRFGELVRRRLRREPVSQILGRKGFRRLELAVDRRVLTPRPETELLVEVALERRPARALDIGTGSGAIALALADELPGCEVVATDTSAAALAVARANAERLGLAGRVRFLEGTLPGDGDGVGSAGEARGTGPGGEPGGGFDLVLANLPYVPEGEWAGLLPEVREWEPREALLAGPDGLDAYRAAIPRLRPRAARPQSPPPGAVEVRPAARDKSQPRAGEGGVAAAAVAVEVGVGQAAAVAELMRAAGFDAVEVRRDLAGIERVVVGAAVGDAGEGR